MKRLLLIPMFLAQSVLGTMLINEDFEGTGTPSGWASGGSVNFDYSTTPLAGLQSLQVPNASLAGYIAGGVLNNTEIWFKCLIRVDTMPASNQIVFEVMNEGAFTDQMQVYILTTGALFVSDPSGSIFIGTVDVLSAGTTYNVWGHYKKGSGTDSISEASFDVAGNPRPNSGNKWAGGTNGHATLNTDRFILSFNPSGAGTFDNLQICDTDCFAAGPTPTPTVAPSPSNRFFLFPQ